MNKKNQPGGGLSVSMVVPVYNEQPILGDFLRLTVSELEEFADDYELVLVDDGSHDETPKILAAAAAQNPRVRVVTAPANEGIGLATVRGLQAAQKDIVFWNTVDRTVDTRTCLAEALPRLESGCDVVSFYRSDIKANSPYQKLMTLGNKGLIDFLYPWKFEAYQQIQFHRRAFLDTLVYESDSYFVSPEILFKARVKGLRICEVETTFHKRPGGLAKGARNKWVRKTLADIFRFWFLWVVLKRPMQFSSSPGNQEGGNTAG